MIQTDFNPALIHIRPLTADAFLPFGTVLGQTGALAGPLLSFSSAETSFAEQHIFDPGMGGESQILWVTYRQSRAEIDRLEVHRLCEQAVVPLTGEITQVVAASRKDGSPDNGTLAAFRIPVGLGICMRPGCWHTTRVGIQEVKCVMLTRRSTTVDLIAHLTGGSALIESSVALPGAGIALRYP